MRSLAILVLVAGCWTNSSTPPPVQPTEPPTSPRTARHVPPPRQPTPQEQTLQAMADFMDRLCACSDMACVAQVSSDMTVWAQSRADDDTQFGEEQTRQAEEIAKRMGECIQRALTPSPAPATPAPTP